MAAAQFLRDLIAAAPYRIHTVLTKRAIEGAIGPSPMASGVQFANRSVDTSAFEHIFRRVCPESDMDHRLTKPNHPWTNGQVERMNRTIKEGKRIRKRSGGSFSR